MLEQPLRGYVLWQPLPAPHTRTAYCTSERVMVGLHRGQVSHPYRTLDGGWRQWLSAGRRGLDATVHPPINTRPGPDLLPATSLGGANVCSH